MRDITILVIDDEPSNIQIIINTLQNPNSKCKIISSSDSVLGLEIAFQTIPDIIITDWEMPKMNGIDVIKELKKNPLTLEIPIIMATGIKLTSDDLKLALESGAFDFIRKPIDEIELNARINSAIRTVEYYYEKAEREKQITILKEEKYQSEIELKTKEILTKTLTLLKINQSYEKFKENLDSINRDKCEMSCKYFEHAQNFSNALITSTNKQIWEELEQHFEQINDSFFKNLISKYPEITKNERKLCAYLRLNLSTKDIASLTLQSQRSIEIARTRLREKLGLKNSNEDLNSYMLNF